ncbi:hypothetical protein ABE871_18075 [Enterococcus gilvus]|uniref:hypothetical protein n=1 Tax=Enterococcus gilvus TaxID=160453 RepID=UPI003D6BE8AE
MKKSILGFMALSGLIMVMGTTEKVNAAEGNINIEDSSIQSMTIELDDNNIIISQEVQRSNMQTFTDKYYDRGATLWRYNTWFNAQGKKTGYSGVRSDRRAHWSKSSVTGGNSQTGRAAYGWSNANSNGPRKGTHHASWGWS